MRKTGTLVVLAACLAALLSIGTDGSVLMANSRHLPAAILSVASAPDTHTTAVARLIGANASNWPVAGGNYVFWVEAQDHGQAIYGYSLSNEQKFLVSNNLKLNASYALSTDGKMLGWLESVITDENASPLYSAYGYDISSRQPLTFPTKPNYGPIFGTFYNGQVFYNDQSEGHYGLFAYDITTHHERMISLCGSRSVAADGILLWSTPEQGCSGHPANNNSTCCYVPQKTILQLSKLDGSIMETTVTSSYGNIQYAVSGNLVAWSVSDPDRPNPIDDIGIHLYDIDSGESQLISTSGDEVFIQGPIVIWNGHPTRQSPAWTVTAYNIAEGNVSLAVKENAPWTAARAFAAGNQLIYTMTPLSGKSKVYLISLP